MGLRANAVGMAWYKRADYPRILEIMADREKLPSSFDRWKQLAEQGEAKLRSQGIAVHRAYIDPEHFVAWCAETGRYVDSQARIDWANMVALRALGGRN